MRMSNDDLLHWALERVPLTPELEAELVAGVLTGRVVTDDEWNGFHEEVLVQPINLYCLNEYEVLSLLRHDVACFEALMQMDPRRENDWFRGPAWQKLMNMVR